MAIMKMDIKKEIQQFVVYGVLLYGCCNIYFFTQELKPKLMYMAPDLLDWQQLTRTRFTSLALILAGAYILSGFTAMFWHRGMRLILVVALCHISMFAYLTTHEVFVWHDMVVPLLVLGLGGWLEVFAGGYVRKPVPGR